jgi:hypothetical protein
MKGGICHDPHPCMWQALRDGFRTVSAAEELRARNSGARIETGVVVLGDARNVRLGAGTCSRRRRSRPAPSAGPSRWARIRGAPRRDLVAVGREIRLGNSCLVNNYAILYGHGGLIGATT